MLGRKWPNTFLNNWCMTEEVEEGEYESGEEVRAPTDNDMSVDIRTWDHIIEAPKEGIKTYWIWKMQYYFYALIFTLRDTKQNVFLHTLLALIQLAHLSIVMMKIIFNQSVKELLLNVVIVSAKKEKNMILCVLISTVLCKWSYLHQTKIFLYFLKGYWKPIKLLIWCIFWVNTQESTFYEIFIDSGSLFFIFVFCV